MKLRFIYGSNIVTIDVIPGNTFRDCFHEFLRKCSNVSKELDEQNCRLRLDKTVLSLRDSPDTLGNGTIYDITVEKTYNSVSKRNDKSSDVVHPSASGFPPMESPSSSSGISLHILSVLTKERFEQTVFGSSLIRDIAENVRSFLKCPDSICIYNCSGVLPPNSTINSHNLNDGDVLYLVIIPVMYSSPVPYSEISIEGITERRFRQLLELNQLDYIPNFHICYPNLSEIHFWLLINRICQNCRKDFKRITVRDSKMIEVIPSIQCSEQRLLSIVGEVVIPWSLVLLQGIAKFTTTIQTAKEVQIEVLNFIVSAEKKRQLMSTFSKDKTLYDFRIQIDSSDIRIPNKQTPKEDNKSFEKEKASLVAAIADEKKRCSDMRTDYENKLAELTKRLEESEKRRNETPKESRFANPQLIDFLHRCSDIWTPKNTPGRTVNEIEDAILSLRNSYFMLRKRIPEIEGLSQLDLNIIGATSFCSQRLKQLRNCCEDWRTCANVLTQQGHEASDILQTIQGQQKPPMDSWNRFNDKEPPYGSRLNSHRRTFFPSEGEPKRNRFDVE
ncbi:hypothetical protein WA171_006212 [Blastocystis sp. BT1]